MIRFLCVHLVILSWMARGQNFTYLPDARLAGMGYAMAAVKNQGIGHGNPASPASSALRFSFCKPLDLDGMDQYAFSFGWTRRQTQFGFSISSIGDVLFKQNLLSAQFGHRIGNTIIALRNDLFQFTGENRVTRFQYGVTIGSFTQLSEKVFTGIYLSNINAISAVNFSGTLPVRMSLGLAYQPIGDLLLVAECSKDIRHSPIFRTGVEYEVVRRLTIRAGVNISTSELYVGTGFRFWKLSADYAFQYSSYRGVVVTASSTIKLSTKQQ